MFSVRHGGIGSFERGLPIIDDRLGFAFAVAQAAWQVRNRREPAAALVLGERAKVHFVGRRVEWPTVGRFELPVILIENVHAAISASSSRP